MTYDFYSDNASGCHPTILAALADANAGTARPYGADSLSQTLDAAVSEIVIVALFRRIVIGNTECFQRVFVVQFVILPS